MKLSAHQDILVRDIAGFTDSTSEIALDNAIWNSFWRTVGFQKQIEALRHTPRLYKALNSIWDGYSDKGDSK